MKIKQHQGTTMAKQLLAKLGSKINVVALVVALFASAMLRRKRYTPPISKVTTLARFWLRLTPI